MANVTFTKEQIESMTPPQARKAVKDSGGDPKALGNGNPAEMKKWLLEKHAPSTKSAGKKVTTAPAAAKPAATAKAAPKPPADTDDKKSETATPAASDSLDKVKKALANNPVLYAYLEELTLRMCTVEDAVGISSGSATPPKAGASVDPYASIREFITPGKDGADDELKMSAEQVQAASKEQLLQVLEILGQKASSADVREIRAQVAGIFGKAPATKPEPAAKEAAVEYAKDAIVKAEYDGKVFDPCQVLAVKKKRGGVASYTIFFNEDCTWCDLEPDAVKGESKKKMTENPADYGWEG